MIKNLIKLNADGITPIYKQIEENITAAIKNQQLKLGDKLPSINTLCKQFNLAPGTVTKAYNELRARGIIDSKQGKGYFISNIEISMPFKIFLLLDRLNAYKEILYYSFIQTLGKQTGVDVFFHHYDRKRFTRLIAENLNKYTHYVIMPHFNEDLSNVLVKIPEQKLLLLDHDSSQLPGKYAAVTQDFKNDLYFALKSGLNALQKYHQLNIVYSINVFQFIPQEIIQSFTRFCQDFGFAYQVIENIKVHPISVNHAYVVFHDDELIYLLKETQRLSLQLGKDIGIISYDDTPEKELLLGGITVASTDFHLMGQKAAEFILNGKKEKICIPFTLIMRNSL